jgi:hypothetical protein
VALHLIFAFFQLHSRVVETILPALVYNSSCASTVALQNLSNRSVSVEIEAHRSDGALVPLEGNGRNEIQLSAGESGAYKLRLKDDPGDAWVKIREKIPSAELSPAIAISGVTECIAGDELTSADRVVAYPVANPWYSGASKEPEVILLVNASEQPARASVCASPVGYYMLPKALPHAICSTEFEVQIAPFGTRRFPVDGEPYSLKTQGDHIVLQMLKPVKSQVQLYSVDSSIKFGDIVHP